ncbi:protein FAR-RED ELONGATED HYPOCOTYL 3-like [Lathyrus oleraceus]|uniref:protein FAR-RED ELONGATED HYPOCOTYL 3-like n=1 Tax=Pisum sativum TaxID=3888 RepID=UPI0021CF5BE6|nr:protein FAR-RED ELONGATED HYPOCOTYL 3-like [Pisum sativum]
MGEKEIVMDMTLNMMQSKNILTTLKRKRPENISNMKEVYNIHVNNNKVLRGDKPEMQQLLKLLDDNNYVSRYQTCEDGVTVRDIYWTHLDLIKFFKVPTVLIIDSMYKINKYKLPLLEIIGVTFIKMTFSVGFVFLENGKGENVSWTLEVCQVMLKDKKYMPKVIVTDRDITLMNSVAKVFPTSYTLLCRHHITKNVRS